MDREDLTLLARSTRDIYLECIRDASKRLITNWILLPAVISLYILIVISQTLFSGFGFAGGFIVGLIGIAFMTLFYSWIEDIARRSRLKLRYMVQFDTALFFSLISFAFFFWIFSFGLQSFAQNADAAILVAIVFLLTALILNPIAETIYIHRFDGFQSILHAARFTLENWLEWLLPLTLLLLPWLLLAPLLTLFTFSQTHPLLSSLAIVRSASLLQVGIPYVAEILGLIVVIWYTIFRGFLFLKLDSSSRRQRLYRAKQQEV